MEAHEKRQSLTADIKDTVQGWADLNGGHDLMTKDQFASVKNNGFLDAPIKWWGQVNTSQMHYWFMTAWNDFEGAAVLRYTIRHEAANECFATHMLDTDIIWRTYSDNPVKVRQGYLTNILLGLNRAPYFRTPPGGCGPDPGGLVPVPRGLRIR